MRDARAWAESTFGEAELGDARRTRRLVQLAAEAARRPSGVVMTACATTASREGAFRLLENDAVAPDAVRDAMCRATARACRDEQIVIVPIDGSSLRLNDRTNTRGLGKVGTWARGAHGLIVMTALALKSDGTAIGIAGQHMWIRTERSTHGRRGKPCAQTSEHQNWITVIDSVRDAFEASAPHCRTWAQVDRGGDSFQVLNHAIEQGLLMTVRANHDRCLVEGDASKKLWATVERGRILAKRKIAVSRRPAMVREKRVGKGKRVHLMTAPRAARAATVAIRATTVRLDCQVKGHGRNTLEINAVLVRETNRSSRDRVEWMLLTTHPIRTRADVLAVVRAYTFRWRIEEFHRLWKTGHCNVEDTQLRSRNTIIKWTTILAAVATRALRLAQLAKTTPDVPATTEFTRTELAAIIALLKPKGIADDHVPMLSVAVRWMAEIGGFSPYKDNPGPITIGRGLYDVLIAARVLENLAQKR